MSNISNRFYVTALEDGTTLHGNLLSNKSLTQAWSGSAAVPDWTTAANQPTIYLTLFHGDDVVPETGLDNYDWYYNGVKIVFSGSVSTDGKFQKTTYNYTYDGSSVSVPALKIIGNLASSSNVDIDTISLSGSYNLSGASLTFNCDTQIRITSVTASGHIGIINFANNISAITDKGQQITMYGTLFDNNGNSISGFTTNWYLGASTTPTSGTSITVDGTTYTNAYQVSEEDVVDHATVKCEFTSDGNVVYTEYASIDDLQDPEYMYIQYNGGNGNAASLKKNQSVTFSIWIGTRDNPAVLKNEYNSVAYNYIYVKLINGEGEVITADNIAGVPNVTSSGWRRLSMNSGKGSITLYYDTVITYGKNITGLIAAQTSAM